MKNEMTRSEIEEAEIKLRRKLPKRLIDLSQLGARASKGFYVLGDLKASDPY